MSKKTVTIVTKLCNFKW